MPDLLTRAELYDKLHERRPGAPARLTEFEREVIFRRASIDAAARGTPAPFRLRAGLIVEILAFYDELRRRDKTIGAFERLTIGSLESSAEIDRAGNGAAPEHVLATHSSYREARRDGRVDEHRLRELIRRKDVWMSGADGARRLRREERPGRHA